jgi:mRNA-degrading endonuclease RelE of RelBE toxin-antitoxin system
MMFQIIFTPVSSAEMSALPKPLQLKILSEFQILTPNFLEEYPDAFGKMRRDDREIFRYRMGDYRLYFEQTQEGLLVHRVLHANTLKDFYYRAQLPVAEDEELQKNPNFWKMIDEPEQSPASGE